MPDPTLLEVEAARAMSGRPAWRVVAACVKGGPCPRCEAAAGVKCRVQHIERVWAQRARERGAAKPARVHAVGAQAFIGFQVGKTKGIAEGDPSAIADHSQEDLRVVFDLENVVDAPR